MGNSPAVCESLRVVLNNMSTLQDAIREIHRMTVNVEDSFSENNAVREGMNQIISGFKKVDSILPAMLLHIGGKFGNGRGISNGIPNFEDVSEIMCEKTLSGSLSSIWATKNIYVDGKGLPSLRRWQQ